ncbi:germin protein precursor [Trifolium repens]|nr:germin protein precursor [Trifolium repens]
MKMIPTIFIIFSLLSFSHASLVVDFCVADYTAPNGPAGYSCKSPENATADDFVYHGLNTSGNITNIFNATVTFAFDSQFPGLNGLGITIGRLDFGVGGVVPLHTHPRGSELIVVIEGTLLAGFVSTNNVAYIKTLYKGDIMVFPQGLLHFQINVGDSNALAFVSLGSANPGLQILDTALFSSNLPSEVIAATSFIDIDEVRKLKGIFGGSDGYTMLLSMKE